MMRLRGPHYHRNQRRKELDSRRRIEQTQFRHALHIGPCRRHHLNIGRGLRGCCRNRPMVSCTSRRWKPAFGHVASTAAMNARVRRRDYLPRWRGTDRTV